MELYMRGVQFKEVRIKIGLLEILTPTGDVVL